MRSEGTIKTGRRDVGRGAGFVPSSLSGHRRKRTVSVVPRKSDLSADGKQEIVNLHNEYRREQGASNMLYMVSHGFADYLTFFLYSNRFLLLPGLK